MGKKKIGAEPIYIDGKKFSVMELKRRMEMEGLDPKTYKQHPEYQRYFFEVRQKAAELKRKRTKMKAEGKLGKDIPITNHPNHESAYMLAPEEDKQVIKRVRKSVIDTLDTMETLKKLAKSRISVELLKKVTNRKRVSVEEAKELSLEDLKQLTSIIQMASKVQLEAGNRYLDAKSHSKVGKGVKASLNGKAMENKDFNFYKFRDGVGDIEDIEKDESEEDVLKNIEKYMRN